MEEEYREGQFQDSIIIIHQSTTVPEGLFYLVYAHATGGYTRTFLVTVVLSNIIWQETFGRAHCSYPRRGWMAVEGLCECRQILVSMSSMDLETGQPPTPFTD